MLEILYSFMLNIIDLNNKKKCIEFIEAVKEGSIFAYPTEAVFGLGCDINNKNSIKRILDLKKRDASKGLIVISDNYEKIRNLVDDKYFGLFVENNDIDSVPTTWLCPASNKVLPEITGGSKNIAIRITKHPVSSNICKLLNFPIVSTSANVSGDAPLLKLEEIINYFDNQIDYIIKGKVGGTKNPTRIIDLISKKVLRGEG